MTTNHLHKTKQSFIPTPPPRPQTSPKDLGGKVKMSPVYTSTDFTSSWPVVNHGTKTLLM